MKNKKMVIGVTGPTRFGGELDSMISDGLGAIHLTINQNSNEDLNWAFEQIDGLVLGGGADIFPGTYGASIKNRNDLSKFDIKRDKRELWLINQCIKAGKPILGICRGFQLLGVYHGFDLITNINGSTISHSPGESGVDLNYEAGEFLHFIKVQKEYEKIYGQNGKNGIGVNSYHHQAIRYDDIESNGLRVAAISDLYLDPNKEKIVEIMEKPEHKIVCSQFHAEIDWQYGNEGSIAVLERFKEFLG